MEQVPWAKAQGQAADLVSVRQVRRRHSDITVPGQAMEPVAKEYRGVEVAAAHGAEAEAGVEAGVGMVTHRIPMLAEHIRRRILMPAGHILMVLHRLRKRK